MGESSKAICKFIQIGLGLLVAKGKGKHLFVVYKFYCYDLHNQTLIY